MGLADDRVVGFLSFFATGTVLFGSLNLVLGVGLSFVLGLFGFLVGGRTTASRAGRGL